MVAVAAVLVLPMTVMVVMVVVVVENKQQWKRHTANVSNIWMG